MSNLPVPNSGLTAGRMSRALARLGDQTTLELARTNAATERELAKLDGLQFVASRAMQGVTMVTQLEQLQSTAVPLAHSRLQAIGDVHALASAEVVASAPRNL